MNRNEMIQKLKDQMKSFLSFSETSVETIEVTTEDGVKMVVNSADLSVGVEIFLINEDGSQSPVENGDYKLEDGRTITVEDGKVSAIADKEDEKSGDETPVEDAPVELAEEPIEEKEPESDLAERVTNLENQISEILSILETISGNNNQMFSKIDEISIELSKQPAEDSVKTAKTNVSNYSKDLSIKVSVEDELENIRKILKSKRNR